MGEIDDDIDGVIAEMERGLAPLVAADDTRRFFHATYLRTTQAVAAEIASGGFEDAVWLRRWDVAFARYYLDALTAADQGEPIAGPWRVAFDTATQRPGLPPIRHVLFGVNAHINFDLPFAAVAAAPGSALASLRNDYLAINAILARTFGAAQSVIDEFSPLLHVLDHVGGRTDEAIANFSIETAREEAWHEATRLAIESGAQLDRAALSLDRRAALLADTIILPGGPLGLAFELIASTESTSVTSITGALLAMA